VPDTAVPAEVFGHTADRVLRAPVSGEVEPLCRIGQPVEVGQLVARVEGRPVRAQIAGVLRGMAAPGTRLGVKQKLGDVDPRGDADLCAQLSDKARAIADGVLEAVRSLRDG
jgi:xanthine dehydrogenase accessory factor